MAALQIQVGIVRGEGQPFGRRRHRLAILPPGSLRFREREHPPYIPRVRSECFAGIDDTLVIRQRIVAAAPGPMSLRALPARPRRHSAPVRDQSGHKEPSGQRPKPNPALSASSPTCALHCSPVNPPSSRIELPPRIPSGRDLYRLESGSPVTSLAACLPAQALLVTESDIPCFPCPMIAYPVGKDR